VIVASTLVQIEGVNPVVLCISLWFAYPLEPFIKHEDPISPNPSATANIKGIIFPQKE
jgi:hypothetical protein